MKGKIYDLKWMSFEEERELRNKITGIVLKESRRFAALKKLKELGGLTLEEELKVLERILEALTILSDEELYFALSEIFWSTGPMEARDIVRMALSKRMEGWDIRKLLSIVDDFYVGGEAKKIIANRTLRKYRNKEKLRKIAARKDRRVSLPAKLALEKIKTIEILRIECGLLKS
jgi:hypothetical protein